MSLNTIIDDLYDRVEDFCIDDILVESDVEMMGDDISLCEGDDDIEDSIDQLDESIFNIKEVLDIKDRFFNGESLENHVWLILNYQMWKEKWLD